MNVHIERRDDGTFDIIADEVLIEYPLWTEHAEPCMPDHYGFTVWETGGGCTAWMRKFEVGGKTLQMLITAHDDPTHEIDRTEGNVGMGVYDIEGDGWVNWTVSSEGGDFTRTEITGDMR